MSAASKTASQNPFFKSRKSRARIAHGHLLRVQYDPALVPTADDVVCRYGKRRRLRHVDMLGDEDNRKVRGQYWFTKGTVAITALLAETLGVHSSLIAETLLAMCYQSPAMQQRLRRYVEACKMLEG